MNKPAWRTPLVILVAGSIVLTLAMGVRHTDGLFLQPMTVDHGWSRETFSVAFALQNLVWGLGSPFAGALADRHGAGRKVLGAAALCRRAGADGIRHVAAGLRPGRWPQAGGGSRAVGRAGIA